MKPKWNIPLKEKRPVNVPLFCFLDGRYSFLPVLIRHRININSVSRTGGKRTGEGRVGGFKNRNYNCTDFVNLYNVRLEHQSFALNFK